MPVTIQGVPDQYMPLLQQLKYNRGVQMSWLAAVCEATGWNPAYKVMNAIPGRMTTRQAGIAGVWLDIPEIVVPGGFFANCAGGWKPYAPWVAGSSVACRNCPPIGAFADRVMMDPVQCLNLATDMLFNCRDALTTWCGKVDAGLFLRWQLGCDYLPPKDAAGNCLLDPNMLQPQLDALGQLVTFQALYAEQFNEPPLVPPTVACDVTHPCPAPLVCVSGYCVEPQVQPGTNPLVWGLLGLVGLVGIIGLVKGSKKQQQYKPQGQGQYAYR